MKRIAAVLALSLLAPVAMAAGAKTYQVTGPVLEVDGDMVVVENKDKEKWAIQVDASTTKKGDYKVGDKVTIQYKMVAASIEAKKK